MLKHFKSVRLPLAIATLGIIGLAGASSLADDRSGDSGDRHRQWSAHLLQMDADKDGSVTQAEVQTFEAARAAEIDADKDGAITIEEIEAYWQQQRARRMAERLARMDQDGNGVVSVEEFEDARTWQLARLDRNGDGTIERREMAHGRSGHHSHWQKAKPSE